jgi:hypothetical protein
VDVPYDACKDGLEVGALPVVSEDDWLRIRERFLAAKHDFASSSAPHGEE